MSNVKVFRFMNGEELIGQVVAESADKFSLKDVASIQLMPGGGGKVNLGLMPFAPYAEESTFEFETKHITTRFTPNTDLLNNYNRVYGAGLVVARTV